MKKGSSGGMWVVLPADDLWLVADYNFLCAGGALGLLSASSTIFLGLIATLVV